MCYKRKNNRITKTLIISSTKNSNNSNNSILLTSSQINQPFLRQVFLFLTQCLLLGCVRKVGCTRQRWKWWFPSRKRWCTTKWQTAGIGPSLPVTVCIVNTELSVICTCMALCSGTVRRSTVHCASVLYSHTVCTWHSATWTWNRSKGLLTCANLNTVLVCQVRNKRLKTFGKIGKLMWWSHCC